MVTRKPHAAVRQLGMVLASLGGATLTLPACGKSPSPPAPTATVSVHPVPADHKVVLPGEWTRCTSDDDCTYVTDGCCATVAVNRAAMSEGNARLRSTPHKYCPVKTACGVGADGTSAGTRGRCSESTCQ